MAGQSSIPSPTDGNNKQKASTSFPKLFTGFASKNFSESAESMVSPTSILDTKSFSALKNPFYASSPKAPEHESRRLWVDSKGIVDALPDHKIEPNLSKPETRTVLFGSQLKIRIPPLPLSSLLSPTESSPKSPAAAAAAARNSQLGPFSSSLSPSSVKKTLFGSPDSSMETPNSPQVFTDMELSEDYTCVISHGPNPVTTHIFDNCIIESCCGVVGSFSTSPGKVNGFPGGDSSYPPESVLSCCYSCKKNLGQGQDIYTSRFGSKFPFLVRSFSSFDEMMCGKLLRGEKAFCSEECWNREILFEEEMDNL